MTLKIRLARLERQMAPKKGGLLVLSEENGIYYGSPEPATGERKQYTAAELDELSKAYEMVLIMDI